MASRFGCDTKQATLIITAYASAGLIELATWKNDQRKPVNVWVVPGQALPTGTQEIPF